MQRTWKRALVGSLDIASALFAFMLCLLATASLSPLKSPLPAVRIYASAVVVFFAVLGALALAGGLAALLGKKWGLALAGSIAASLSLPPFGIAATVLLSGEAGRLTRLLVLIILGPLWLAYLAVLVLVLLGYRF